MSLNNKKGLYIKIWLHTCTKVCAPSTGLDKWKTCSIKKKKCLQCMYFSYTYI